MHTSEIKLGIATCVYNRGNLMQRLFCSLVNQRDYRFIWYVVDDGSTDDSWQYIESFKKTAPFEVVTHRIETNNRSVAHNLFLDVVKTEYVIYIDDDDIAIPETIFNCYKLIEAFPKNSKDKKYYGIAGVFLDTHGKHLSDVKLGSKEYIDASNIDRYRLKNIGKNLLHDKAIIHKTQILATEKYPIIESEVFTDDDFVANRIAEKGYIIRWTNIPLAIREYRDNGITKQSKTFALKNIKSLRMSIKERNRIMPFPRNFTCLGTYYYLMNARNDAKKNTISLCANEIGVGRITMIIGIILKRLTSIILKTRM